MKSTLHYDTTTRNTIDGEWPAIILYFSNGDEYVLRPLFFAYEELLVETYSRLSVAASVDKQENITPADLWEKTDAIMTDSVLKNLKIEDLIGESLAFDHWPYHLLNKSHTVEKRDATNLEVLATIEKSVKQRELFESINPSLKSFFRGKKTVVEAGIDALMTVVSHDKSGKSCSQAELFDLICEREGVYLLLYQQNRLTKMGKSAAALVEVHPILIKLIDEISLMIQLKETCMLYLSSEFFYTELETLAYFNHTVTFPFLHCVEKSSQEELLKILPKLHQDLLEGKTDTWIDFVVEIRRVPVKEPSNELGRKLQI